MRIEGVSSEDGRMGGRESEDLLCVCLSVQIDVFEHVEVKGKSQWEELEREEELEEVIEESESEEETEQESD